MNKIIPILVVIFCVIAIFKKGILLTPENLIFNYPFISYDGFQWISDGLHYLDNRIEVVQRNPALPILFSILRRMSSDSIYPILTSILLCLHFFAMYWMLKGCFRKEVAALTTACFYFVFKLQHFFDFVLADPWCLTLITAAIGSAFHCFKKPWLFYVFATFLALAFNFQYAPAFCSPAFLYFSYYLYKQGWIRENGSKFLIGSVLFTSIASAQFIYKYMHFGDPLHSGVVHFGILGFHLWGIPYHLIGFLAFLGIPFSVIVIYGFLNCFRTFNFASIFFLLYFFANFFVWILLYKWLDVRFQLYFIPAFAYFFAFFINLIFPEDIKASFASFHFAKKLGLITTLFLGLNFASVKLPAFEASQLPITPWNIIAFESKKISPPHWTYAPILTQFSWKTTNEIIPLLTYFKFYKTAHTRNADVSNDMISDLETVRKFTADMDVHQPNKIGLCGGIYEDHALRHSVFWTIGLNVVPCDVEQVYFKIRFRNPHEIRENILMEGKIFELFR